MISWLACDRLAKRLAHESDDAIAIIAERAAIIEFDAGMNRDRAEDAAIKEARKRKVAP